MCAGRRPGTIETDLLESRQSRPAGACGVPVRRQRVRPRCGDRRSQVPLRAEDRIRDARCEGADRAGRDPFRSRRGRTGPTSGRRPIAGIARRPRRQTGRCGRRATSAPAQAPRSARRGRRRDEGRTRHGVDQRAAGADTLIVVARLSPSMRSATSSIRATARSWRASARPMARASRMRASCCAAGAQPPITAGQNTTIGVVATNARLTKVQATKVAQMAHDGLARAIYPAHTMGDGDVDLRARDRSESTTPTCRASARWPPTRWPRPSSAPCARPQSIPGYPAAGDYR